VLFNTQGVVYRFQTEVSPNGQSVTNLWRARAFHSKREDKVAKLEWPADGGLSGRVVLGKNTLRMADLVPNKNEVRYFNGPDGLQYRWCHHPSSSDILLKDAQGIVIAFFRPTRATQYNIGTVFGELHFDRTAGTGTVMHPPMMDTVTVSAMLYRFSELLRTWSYAQRSCQLFALTSVVGVMSRRRFN